MENDHFRSRVFRVAGFHIPEAVIQERDRRYVTSQTIRSGAFVHWPSGHPCIPVNQYLIEQSYEWTGGSAQTYAFQLGQLVSYCGRRGKAFGELSDGDIKIFIRELSEEKTGAMTGGTKRNNNTIRNIIHRCICFLTWFQAALYRGAKPLIGRSGEGASITVTERWNKYLNRVEFGHRYMPEPVSTERKLPVSRQVIEALEDAIEVKGTLERLHEMTRRAHGLDDEFSGACVDYLWARRRFILWLLQATGLRPGEMMLLTLSDLEAVIACEKDAKSTLLIPTLKRRRNDPPRRAFVLHGAQVESVRRYLIALRSWKTACRSHGIEKGNAGAVFLGTKPGEFGGSLTLSALEKDFLELRNEAGLSGQQVCFSMFRHRFITLEVRKLLKEFKLTGKKIVTDSDYRALLERVRQKTGHADVRSLWHYIDLARNDDGLWDNVEASEARAARLDSFNEELAAIRRDLSAGRLDAQAATDKISEMARRMQSIIRPSK
ncbi:hypothetical protein ACN9MY_06210 [Pseudoduganella sp. R-31]|uniref:hypothetical protein n=1 Tax=Pseudoduganella sp. R-31 TaxID=3404060 RepID=UPI003CF54B81